MFDLHQRFPVGLRSGLLLGPVSPLKHISAASAVCLRSAGRRTSSPSQMWNSSTQFRFCYNLFSPRTFRWKNIPAAGCYSACSTVGVLSEMLFEPHGVLYSNSLFKMHCFYWCGSSMLLCFLCLFLSWLLIQKFSSVHCVFNCPTQWKS